MVALLCPHHSPTTARPGDRPCGETGCRPGQSPTALFAPFPDPKPVDFKGKRLELGGSPGWKSPEQPHKSGNLALAHSRQQALLIAGGRGDPGVAPAFALIQ